VTESETDLARRLVDHPRWRWMAGMLLGKPGPKGGKSHFDRVSNERYDWEADDGTSWDGGTVAFIYDNRFAATGNKGRLPIDYVQGWPDVVPDLTDPATCGCLLAMLWDESPNANLARRAVAGHAGPDSPIPKEYRSPGAALASALLAAWEAKP
jgi:hypothetical protein